MSEWWTYSPSDFLLFSPRTYYRLFELYNAAIWPLQIPALALGAAILGLLLRDIGWRGRAIAAILAACWLWVAWAYLLRRYDTINWAASYFALGFALEALLLAWTGIVRDRLRFRSGMDLVPRTRSSRTPCGKCDRELRVQRGTRIIELLVVLRFRSSQTRVPRNDANFGIGPLARIGGLGLFLFALAIYPLIGPLAGRPWAQVEIFGVAPDPTAIATLGVLAMAQRPHWPLLVVPLIWCAISGATLWTMQSPDALVVPIAAALALTLAGWKSLARPRRASPERT